MADRSFATLKVLRALVDHAAEDEGVHGLQLAREAHIASGTLYPILDKLEDEGVIVGEFEAEGVRAGGGPRRRFYTLTGAGRVTAVAELSAAAGDLWPSRWGRLPKPRLI